MTPERWQRVRSLFHRALDWPESQRHRLLQSACPDDAVLRLEVEDLLSASTNDGFLDRSALESGAVVADRYRIQRRIARGGNSVVLLAADERIAGKPVVVKVLDNRGGHAASLQKRFRKEIDILGRIDHPAIVAAHDCGELPDGRPFLVMDFVDGITLRERLAQPIDAAEIADIVRQIGGALEAAHRQRIFHRDLKPENVMLQKQAGSESWSVKLIDFGIAKMDLPNAAATTGLFIAGTVQYMAPEQFFGVASPATDIYALGILCCEMLLGRLPYESDQLQELARRHDTVSIPALKELPAAVRPLIRRALCPAPAKRPQDAGEFARAFAAALLHSRAVNSRSRLLAAAGLLAAVAVLGAGARLLRRAPSQPGLRPSRAVRLTDPGEYALDPAVSPDGKWIAYAADHGKTGHTVIWLRDAATGAVRQLTFDPDGAGQPAFSPDGATVAYRSNGGRGAIYTVPLAGGTAVKLVDDGQRPRYSPDGTLVAYSTGDYESGLGRVYTVHVAARKVVERNRKCDSAASPIWSSDGRALLMWCNNGAGAATDADFWTIPVNGGAATRTGAAAILSGQGLQPTAGQSFFAARAWIGGRVVFPARKGREAGLWSISIPESTGKAEGPAQPFEIPGIADADDVSVSASGSGRLLALSTLTSNADIWSLPLRPDGLAAPEPAERVTSDPATDRRPSLASDGKSLVFVSDRSGEPSVWHKDLATGVERRLTAGLAVKLAPRISPDGSQVIFSSEQDGIRTVWLAETSSSPAHPRKICSACGYPRTWWPDGRRILLDPTYDGDLSSPVLSLSFRDLTSAGEIRVPTFADWIEPKISSDGRWAVIGAYARGSPPIESILVVPLRKAADGAPIVAPAEEWVALSDRTAFDALPAWGAGGGIVYFTSNTDGHTCIWARRVDPATKRPLGGSFAVYHSHDAALSLDNLGVSLGVDLAAGPGRLVFTQTERSGSIWMARLRP